MGSTDVLFWPGMRSEYSWIPPGEAPSFTGPNQVGVSFSAHRGTVFETSGRTSKEDVADGSVFVTGADPGRGAVPSWANEMAEMSWCYWLTFDGLSAAPRVSVPATFVHSDDCVLPDNVKAVRDRLGGPAELVWTEGGQMDFYDQPEQVSLAVNAAAEHFRKTLPE